MADPPSLPYRPTWKQTWGIPMAIILGLPLLASLLFGAWYSIAGHRTAADIGRGIGEIFTAVDQEAGRFEDVDSSASIRLPVLQGDRVVGVVGAVIRVRPRDTNSVPDPAQWARVEKLVQQTIGSGQSFTSGALAARFSSVGPGPNATGLVPLLQQPDSAQLHLGRLMTGASIPSDMVAVLDTSGPGPIRRTIRLRARAATDSIQRGQVWLGSPLVMLPLY